MKKSAKREVAATRSASLLNYKSMLSGLVELLEAARHTAARAVNAVMTATYWEIGRRIIEFEQGGERRATYGEQLLEKLSGDLTGRFGRGFGVDNLQRMRAFYLTWPPEQIYATLSRKSAPESQSPSAIPIKAELDPVDLAKALPLPWSHYVLLLKVKKIEARKFYEEEALRGGWTVRQLHRQINTLFYERTLMSRNKVAMLAKGAKPRPEDAVTPEEEIKDPFVLEFLDLKDEYSESELEEALVKHLESFLLELGSDFTFVGRQKRLRIGDEWFRVDLLFFHRRLRCLMVIDLKIGKFGYADAGQMHMYCNYAREHWTHADENPPVGLILCAEKDAAVAHYALDGLPNKVMVAEYRTVLPDEKTLAEEIARAKEMFTRRRLTKGEPEDEPAGKRKRRA